MGRSTLALMAILSELGAFSLFGATADPDQALAAYLLAHAPASLLLALAVYTLIPPRQARPRVSVLALLFCGIFFVPVLGFVGVTAGALLRRLLPRLRAPQRFSAVRLPELDIHEGSGKSAAGFRQAGVRQFLKNERAPVPQRLRAMVALSHAPSRIGSPVLRELLGDAEDDLRLLAYGLLDSREKRLNADIHAARQRLAASREDDERAVTAHHLAALYWELVYQGLVQGDLLDYAVGQALDYTEIALRSNDDDPALHLQHGRLLQQLGRLDEADQAYTRARALGLPASRVVPYLAELAFARRDYAQVRRLLAAMNDWEGLSRLQPVLRFWGHT
jgi:polysaccharide biosynthesis protein PelE